MTIDTALMRHAVDVKNAVIDTFPRQDAETETRILETIYNVLSRQHDKGVWPIPDGLLGAMISALRS